MPAPTDASFRRLCERVTSLEELLTHFERTVSDLDGVVREAQDRLDNLTGRLERMLEQVHGLTGKGEEDGAGRG